MLLLTARAWGAEEGFDFFSDKPIPEVQLVHVEPPKPEWMTIGGPIALLTFFFTFCFIVRWLIPAVIGFIPCIGFIFFIVDLLFPLWDAKKQTLHDKAVKSVVIVVPK